MIYSSRYESIRKLREISVRKTEQLFMESLGVLDQNRVFLKSLDVKRKQSVSSISGQEGSFEQTASWRALCYDYVKIVNEEIRQVEQEIERVEAELFERRIHWQEAMKELKKVEHLMELEFEGQKQLEGRREERVQDDLQMSRWGRVSRTDHVSSSPEKGRENR